MDFRQKLAFDFEEHHRENGEDFVKDVLEMIAEVKKKVQSRLGSLVTMSDIRDVIKAFKLLQHVVVNNTKIIQTLPNLLEATEKAEGLILKAFRGNNMSLLDLIEQYLVLIVILAGTVNDFRNIVVNEDPKKYWNKILTTLDILGNQFPTTIVDSKFYEKMYNILEVLIPQGYKMLLPLLATLIGHSYNNAPAGLMTWITDNQMIAWSFIGLILLFIFAWWFARSK